MLPVSLFGLWRAFSAYALHHFFAINGNWGSGTRIQLARARPIEPAHPIMMP